MLDERIEELLVERFTERIEEINLEILKTIGSHIKTIKNVKKTDLRRIEQILKYGGSYNKLLKKIEELTALNLKEIEEIFEEVAKNDSQFAEKFYKYRDIDYILYEQNELLKMQVKALGNLTKRTYLNISNTTAIGYSIKDNKGNVIFKTLSEAYKDMIDKAVLSISQGKSTFDREMYDIMKNFAGNGLKTIDYGTNRSMRLDSAIEMNLRGAIRDLHNELQEEFGKTFGADGVEITVHLFPAPDHEDVQGRQFSDEEFEKLQNGEIAKDIKGRRYTLKKNITSYRPISKMNCYHSIFKIIMGVSKANYTDEELQKIKEDNRKGCIIDGKRYTMYECTQLQRRLEREIRKQKDIQIFAKYSDNKELLIDSQKRINQLGKKYKQLSIDTGLSVKAERLRVKGYTRVATKNKK